MTNTFFTIRTDVAGGIFAVFIAVSLMFMPTLCKAQTGLYTYTDGYFIRNGNTWTEYRPKDKNDAWAVYTQYDEKENFFQIKNFSCHISVPKNTSHNFFIYKNGKWEVIYYTKNVYNYFTDRSRHIYCYDGGYFVRDGNDWREYRPNDRAGIWAEYKQYDEEEAFFQIKSSACNVSVPKSTSNSFYIYKNGRWEVVYTTKQIFDELAEFDFNFMYSSHKIANSSGKLIEYPSPARLSFSRKGKGQLCYDGKIQNFTFSKTSIATFKNSNKEMGFRIDFGTAKFIFFFDDWCVINNEPTFPYMNFNNIQKNSGIEKVKSLIRNKIFFK